MNVQDMEKCFACGPANKEGLQLCFEHDKGLAKAQVVLDDIYQGYPGIAHGGIVTTLLDEAMVHALVDIDILAVTARLEVRFHNPVPVGERLTVQGRLEENKSSRRIKYLSAQILDDDENVLASGVGKFLDQTRKILQS